jgi:hypothetical protein
MPKIDNLEPLLAAPGEALDVEFKCWLDLRGDAEHQGLLAKAAIALANEGGGVIVIGYREERPDLISEPRPAEIAAYDADLINNIIRRFAAPAFHCTLEVVPDPQTGHLHAVVEVPGGFAFPVMSKSGTPANTIRPHLCYMRKPGPESAPPENQADWERLLARCLRNRREDMLDAIRNIVLGGVSPSVPAAPSEAERQDAFVAAARVGWETLIKDLPGDAPARCPLGRYELDYALLGDFAQPRRAELLEKLRLAVAHRSNWPEFWVPSRDEIKPVAIDGTIQCWLGTPEMGERDPGHVDFWRASPEGRMFLLRGYFEDTAGGWPSYRVEPGTIIDIREPVWRVAECLDHARILGSLLAPDQEFKVLFRAHWHGLAGRHLSSLDPGRSFYMRDYHRTQQNEFVVEKTFDIGQITDNLPEIIQPLLKPLYELFDFFELTMHLVRQTLANRRA